MSRSRESNSPSQLAQEIQRRLSEVQGAPPVAPAEESAPPANGGIRVTKEGEVIPPGQEVPRDANGEPVAHSVIPDATFHAPCRPRPPLFIAKSVAIGIRLDAELSKTEDGGALFGDDATGDIVARLSAPPTAKRTDSVIEMRGSEMDEGARRVLGAHPGSVLLGFYHSHLALPDLSSGDLTQIDELHGKCRVPARGLVILLAIKTDRRPRLRAWVSPRRNVVEEVDLVEVDDPRAARARHPSHERAAPVLEDPFLASGVGAKRLEREITELEGLGYQVAADVDATGVRLDLSHSDLKGHLELTIPAEGWARPPKIRFHRDAQRSDLFTVEVALLLSAWSSAYTLSELVDFVRSRRLWPRHSRRRPTPAKVTTALAE